MNYENPIKAAQMPPPPLPATRSLAHLVRHGTWRLDLPHALPHDRLYWITRGQGKLLLQGRQSGFGAHNAIHVPAGCLHALDTGRQGYGIVLDLPIRDSGGLLPEGGQVAVQLRIRDGQSQSELTGILDAIQREEQSRQPHADTAIAAHATLAVVWLRRHAPDHPPVPDSAASRLVAAFCDLLVRAPAPAETMADLAARLSVTPTHLSRACKQVSGRTAATLMTAVTLHRARGLIEDSDIALNSISATLGFGSAAYFSRFVQVHTGLAPSKLRAKAQQRRSAGAAP